MKLSRSRLGRSMNSIFRLWLCLVLVVLVTAGAVMYTDRSYTGGILPDIQVCQAEPLQYNNADYILSAIGGNEPVIQVFKADPMELAAADASAVYTFKIRRAKNVQINEAGTNIRNISNPSGATLQGTATGLPAAAIPIDDSGKFITLLIASNDYSSAQAELTLSLAQDLLPPGQPAGPADDQTEARSPQWLDQYSTPRTSAPPATHNEPAFFTCPDRCPYCLKAVEAANLGYAQRCSDARCYYSPDDQQNWYCYSEPEGWCCADGNVYQTTRSECTRIGGFWSIYQAEAIEACQPKGYCCIDGQVYYPTTESECFQLGGSYWSTSQVQTMERCQPSCWCCVKGQVIQTDQVRCLQAGGDCYPSYEQAQRYCGQQTQTPPPYLK